MTRLKEIQNNKGFTLIEILLYVAISSSVLFIAFVFMFTLIDSREKNQIIAEVEQQGLFAMSNIGESIQKADSVIIPLPGSFSSGLSLAMSGAGENPTLFSQDVYNITVQEGSGSPISLTNQNVRVDFLYFENVSRSNTEGLIKVVFTLSYHNPHGPRQFDFTKTFQSSFSLK